MHCFLFSFILFYFVFSLFLFFCALTFLLLRACIERRCYNELRSVLWSPFGLRAIALPAVGLVAPLPLLEVCMVSVLLSAYAGATNGSLLALMRPLVLCFLLDTSLQSA